MLMDLVHAEAVRSRVASVRVHWHEWIDDVHRKLHEMRGSGHSQRRKLIQVGLAYSTARLVCFDEMAVHDVADALLLRTIVSTMLERGVELVATSNRPPRGLYENGINRSLFLPFISLLESSLVRCDLDVLAAANDEPLVDYRRRHEHTRLYVVGQDHGIVDSLFPESKGDRQIPIAAGRSLRVRARRDDTRAEAFVIDFNAVCDAPLAAPDYHRIADACDALLLRGLPQLSMDRHDIARRFLALVDVLYDRRKLLVILDAAVPIDDLLRSSDMDDAQTTMHVANQGGSSGRLTTFVGGGAEWSATGRIGASLGKFSGRADTLFAWDRLTSRLVEMTASPAYLADWRERRLLVRGRSVLDGDSSVPCGPAAFSTSSA